MESHTPGPITPVPINIEWGTLGMGCAIWDRWHMKFNFYSQIRGEWMCGITNIIHREMCILRIFRIFGFLRIFRPKWMPKPGFRYKMQSGARNRLLVNSGTCTRGFFPRTRHSPAYLRTWTKPNMKPKIKLRSSQGGNKTKIEHNTHNANGKVKKTKFNHIFLYIPYIYPV